MKFKELEKYKTTIENYPLKWRFDSMKADELAEFDDNLTIINKRGCEEIASFIKNWNLHSDFPFSKDLFFKNECFSIAENTDTQIKAKLDSFGFHDRKMILLEWNNETAVLTYWRFVTRKQKCSDFGK
jgi:hypothetical protein